MKELLYSFIFSFLLLIFSCKNEIPENKESIQKTEKDIERKTIESKISTLKGFSKHHYAEVNLVDKENNESIISIYNKPELCINKFITH